MGTGCKLYFMEVLWFYWWRHLAKLKTKTKNKEGDFMGHCEQLTKIHHWRCKLIPPTVHCILTSCSRDQQQFLRYGKRRGNRHTDFSTCYQTAFRGTKLPVTSQTGWLFQLYLKTGSTTRLVCMKGLILAWVSATTSCMSSVLTMSVLCKNMQIKNKRHIILKKALK